MRLSPPARWALVAGVAVGLVSTLAIVVQALALASLLTEAMRSGPPSVVGGRTAALVWLCAGVAGRGLCALAAETLARLGAVWTQAELRSRLLARLLERAPVGGASAGELATVAGRGVESLEVYVGRCLPDLVLAAVAPLALVGVIGALDWVSAVVVAGALVLFPVFGALVGRASRELAGRRWQQLETLGRQVVDVFEGMAVLKAFGRSRRQRDRIAQAGEALRQASLDTLRVAFLSALVLDEVASVSVALVAVPLGLRLLHGGVALGSALAVLMVAPEVFVPLRRASAEFHQSTEGLAALDSVMRVLDGANGPALGHTPARPTASGAAVPAGPDPAGVAVSLHRVSLHRPGRRRPVLEGVDLSLAPGEIVAIVGPNGAGKSTILSMLLGFAEASSGAVLVDGHDLRACDVDAWRRRIAYLPEHPTLLAATLADNLRLADPTADDRRLTVALQAVGAHEMLGRLDHGLGTLLGEGGRVVSAGERQRIALARVLLRPASLYLLDEPTVHLDTDSEAAVVEGLRSALAGSSALIVTHRTAVLSLAHRVVTLDAGRLSPRPPAPAEGPGVTELQAFGVPA